MRTTRKMAPDKGVSGAGFHAVVVYEDFVASRQALELCDFLNRQLGGEVEFRSTLWKLDLLGEHGLSHLATMDAMDAHIIIVALNHSFDLPPHIERWIRAWAARKQSQEAVLLALLDCRRSPSDPLTPAQVTLERIAGSAGIDFVAGRVLAVAISAPEQSLSANTPVAYEGWGLND